MKRSATFKRKYFMTAKDADGGLLITTSAEDLEHDRVIPEGVDLSGYAKNPAVLWLHDSWGTTEAAGIPIGTSGELTVIPGKGIRAAGIRWLEDDPFADRVRNAFEQGVIRGASIGFQPIKHIPNELGGTDYLKWRLLEWSLVPLPANPEAVREEAQALVVAMKALGGDGVLQVLMTGSEQAPAVAAMARKEVRQMPIPKPDGTETRDEFLDRCMADAVMVDEFPDQDQRFAVCQDTWETRAAAVPATGIRVPRAVIDRLCPPCAEKMRALGWTHLKLRLTAAKQIPPDLLDGLCAAIGDDPGFFTACMDFDFGEFAPGDKEGFCAWLHNECTGVFPAEHEAAPATEQKFSPEALRAAILAAFRNIR